MQRLFVEKYKVKIFLERSVCTLGFNIKLDIKQQVGGSGVHLFDSELSPMDG
jgi:hypothetical protein